MEPCIRQDPPDLISSSSICKEAWFKPCTLQCSLARIEYISSFTEKIFRVGKVGEIAISSDFNFNPIPPLGSPFALNVVGDESATAQHANAVFTGVKVSGPALTQGRSFVTNQFLMDTRGSGVTGGLNAFMEGPGRAEVGFKENLDGTIHVQYKPQKSGVYKLHIKFGDTHIQGSPFIIDVN